MAYFPNFQPYPYQDQLNQLRTANPMTMQMQGFPPMQARPEPGGLNWVQGEAGGKELVCGSRSNGFADGFREPQILHEIR